MKKLLLTLMLAVATITAKAITATIYVKADKAPYLYGWYTISGRETKLNGLWPGKEMTETKEVTNKEGVTETFFCQTFNIEASSFNIIFNNGDTKNMRQTGNISNVSSDRYFTYDGASTYKDITEEFGVDIPDVEIQSVALISEVNGWDGLAQLFTEVEKNAKYTYNLDLTNTEVPEDFYRFKFIVNSSAYLDWNTTGLTRNDPNEWIEEDTGLGGGNMGIALDEAGTRTILFTLTFAGGKDIYSGWTLTVEKGTSSVNGITFDTNNEQATYNLAGQRTTHQYKGIVVAKGKKMVRK